MISAEATSGDRAAVRDRLSSYRRDVERLLSRWEELLALYPNQWVALHEDRVFHAAELDALFAQLRLAEIDPARVPREFLTTRDQPALLL